MTRDSLISDLKNKKAELERQLKILEEEQKTLEKNSLRVRVADLIHGLHCRANHVDGCGWEYEDWNNPGYARTRGLMIADVLIERVGRYLESILGNEPTEEMIFNTIKICQERYW